jgi:uncharacterized protein (DUF58 family)
LNLKEPGEEERNIFDRVFLFYRWKWLMEQGGAWEVRQRSPALKMAPGETVETRLGLVPKQRGVLELDDIRVKLPDPFGFFQRCRFAANEPGKILIIPKRYQLPRLRLKGESELKMGGETASDFRGDGGEFLALREYQAGDSLRRIDWKAWARTGDPTVREYEETYFPRYGLILDTSLKDGAPEMFEEAVSVAASFVSTMAQGRCLLDLMFVRDSPEVFTAGRGVAKATNLLEVLARVQANDRGGYDELDKLVARYASEMTAGVVVLSSWNKERENFLQRLRAAGLELRVYVIGNGKAPREARDYHWLRWNRVQEDLFRKE